MYCYNRNWDPLFGVSFIGGSTVVVTTAFAVDIDKLNTLGK